MFAGNTAMRKHNGDHTVLTDDLVHRSPEGHEDLSALVAGRTPEVRRRTGRRAWSILAIVGICAVGAAAASTWPRLRVPAALAETTQKIDQARRSVSIVSPTPSKAVAEVRLPGSTSALQETIIYARTSGYISSLTADIGDRVRAGQLLATIASPEVDQQLNEARARREEGHTNLVLAGSRLKRLKSVSASGAVSAQQLDDAQALYNSQLAAQRVSDDVVSRLETDQSYQKVIAPFDGVITRRNIELGSLITAGSGTSVSSLFELTQQNTMRIFVDVPQSWSPSITVGMTASVELREFPDETFQAKVVRTSSALDPATRTLRTELHIANPQGRLLPGMYVQVKFSCDNSHGAMVVPSNTLVIDSNGVNVVRVDSQGRIVRTPVRIGRDFGREVEVVSGLSPDARLVVSPRDDLAEGETVTVVQPSM